jgi:hypothetical protein
MSDHVCRYTVDPQGAYCLEGNYKCTLSLKEIEAMLNEHGKLERCVSFFRSVIQSGEPWTDTCQKELDALKEGG